MVRWIVTWIGRGGTLLRPGDPAACSLLICEEVSRDGVSLGAGPILYEAAEDRFGYVDPAMGEREFQKALARAQAIVDWHNETAMQSLGRALPPDHEANWQPIATAPKDRHILLWCPDDGGRWFAGCWDQEDRSFIMVNTGSPLDLYADDETHPPTHWMHGPDQGPTTGMEKLAAADLNDVV